MSSGDSSSRLAVLGFLAKHSVIYGTGNLLARVVGFVLLPMYTRYLTPFDYGLLEIIDTTTGMIGLVAGLGIATAMSRFYFDFADLERRNIVVATTLILATCAAAAVLTLGVPFAGQMSLLLFRDGQYSQYFVLAIMTLSIGILVDLAQMYLRIVDRSFLFIGVSLANLIIGVALNIYFIAFAELGVIGIFLSSLITKLVVGVPLLIAVVRIVGFQFDRTLARAMYRYALPMMPSEVASVAIGYSDRFLINAYLSTSAAGIYGLAQKLGTVLHVLITSPFLLVYGPKRFQIGRESDAPRVFATVFDYHMLVLFLSSAALALFAKEILIIMTAPQFFGAAPLLPLIAFSMIVLAAKYHFEYGILHAKQTRYHMAINVSSAFLHLALNIFLIPWIGLWGALVSSTLAFGIKSACYLIVSQRLFPIPYNFGRLALLGAASTAVTGLGLLAAPAGILGTAFKAILLAALPLVLISVGVPPRDERRAIWQQALTVLRRIV